MNENAKKLVAALRSGEYSQARERLRMGDSFCCLGVACDLHAEETGEEWITSETDWKYLGETAVLPPTVQKWLGFADRCGVWNEENSLADMNDFGATFEEIADMINSEPLGLFI